MAHRRREARLTSSSQHLHTSSSLLAFSREEEVQEELEWWSEAGSLAGLSLSPSLSHPLSSLSSSHSPSNSSCSCLSAW